MAKRQFRAFVINPKDNVAIVLGDIPKGHQVQVDIDGKIVTVKAKHGVPCGHKIALTRIPRGEAVIKYGEVVGYAKQDILRGEHIHVHNVAGRDEIR
ncbi:UxaA family hydrolase [Candidatus Bathyarchaeota archaeon]|nr:UxaA family hydrolase [Candidatus Bathyarchaeota archaeon]